MLNFKIVESQKLIFSRGPVVAADTTNLEAKFEVNDLFDGTLRAYWNVRGSVVDSFKVDLDASGICTIPSEVLASISDPSMYGDIDHILQVSVVSIGDDDTIRITSTTCEIPVYKSSYTGNISQPSKPSGGGNITNIITGAALNGKQLDFYNGNNVIFSAPLDRLDSFLLPLLGGKMQGDINMDGHAITGLADAVNDGDALSKAFAKTLFAPSGYVINTISVASETQLDDELATIIANMGNATERHVVFLSTSPTLFDGANVLCSIFKNTAYHGTACFISYGANGVVKWYKNLYNGTWQPLEWDNPPMLPGVEYRTTERCNGATVFAKRIRVELDSIDAASALVDTTIPHNIPGFSELVRIDCIKNQYVLPHMKDNGGFTDVATVDSAYITLRNYKVTWSQAYWDFDLYYTKS